MGKYQAYPEYKDSGVEWLGQVPLHWDIKRVGSLFEERREKVNDVDFPPLSVTMQGIVPQLDNAAKSDAGDNRKLVKAGDFVINSRSDRKGASGISYLTGSVSLISIVMSPRKYQSQYFHHLFRCQAFQEEFYRYGKGIVADLWSTNSSELKNILVPDLPQEEADLIASFLDHETAKIDTLIEQQHQLIQLLKEKRQAVISHAVTKGLNPDSPMKDSGVEWLGEVPAHWDIKKFNHCVSIRNGLIDPTIEPYRDYTLIAPNHIESGTGKVIGLETAADQGADSGKYICKKGEVIYSKIRPALAKACLSPNDETICSADMYPMAGMAGISNEFVFLTLLSNWFTSLVVLESDRVAMPKINREKLSEVKIPVPPFEEQISIKNYVSNRISAIDELLIKANLAIEIMQERRTALISAAVTGKIDVRNWQAPQQ